MSSSTGKLLSIGCTRRQQHSTTKASGDGDHPFSTRSRSERVQEERDKLRQLELELAHMNRLGVMGKLTASLAHEVTQPAASARNNAYAAIRFLEKSPPHLDLADVREALGCIVDDVTRALDIIDRVRDHVKKAPPRWTRLDLGETILQVIGLARNTIVQNKVSVQTQLIGGACPVYGDRTQLQQVVLNLILNAVDAMSWADVTQRELSISVESQADGLAVRVRDSGPGIDHELLEHIFEPFYTTKDHGTGMGLPICRSIIESHGGRLWAEPNVPRGSVFWFTLPVRSGAHESLSGPTAAVSRPEIDSTISPMIAAADPQMEPHFLM
jgi:C4-dicarboxylate-specific signal transduction histidine kinase